MRFVVLLPWRPTDDWRRFLWDVTRPHLEELGPIFLGDAPGPWSRAKACNAAAQAAGDWDVALVADADTIPEPGSIERAVSWVRSTGGAARPHLDRFLLTKQGTMKGAQRGFAHLEPGDWAHTWPGGGLLVLTRDAYERVGGYDERFIGWGAEDTSINLRLLREARWDRLPGKAWHLWHQQGRPSPQTKALWNGLYEEFAPDIAAWGSNQRGYELVKEAL